jgi:hypothetical protein
MDFKKILSTSAFLMGAALNTSCIGGGGAQPLDANTAQAVIGNAVTNVLAKLPTSANPPSLPGGLDGITISSSNVRSMAAGCETITPTTIVDMDADNIPAEKNYNFDCVDLAVGEISFTRKGSLSILDKDESVAGLLGGMRVEFDIDSFGLTTADGSEGNFTFNGFWDYVQNATNLVSESEFTGEVQYSSPAYEYKLDYEYGYKWDYTMTPDTPTDSAFFTTGRVDFDAEFMMNGEFYAEVDGEPKSYKGGWKITMTSENLRYLNSCSRWYNSGKIRIKDGSVNVYELEFNCDSIKFYVNGAESDWYTPQ